MSRASQTGDGQAEFLGPCLRPIEIERHLAGDLGPEDRRQFDAHAGACEACRRRLEQGRAANERYQSNCPAGPVLAQVRAESHRRAGRGPNTRWLVPAAAACAAVLVLLGVLLPRSQAPGVRTKGAVEISLYLMRGDRVRPALPADRFQQGDRIQFVYSSPGQRYLFLVSLDDAGRVANFNYRATPHSVAIEPGVEQVLEGSIILDEAPHAERIFALFSDQPLAWDEVHQAALRAWQAAARADGDVVSIERLPINLPQASILLRKGMAGRGP